MTEILHRCPVCQDIQFTPFLQLKDHFLTGEVFNILECRQCGFKFVSPRPDEKEISRYYESKEYISHDTSRKDLFTVIYTIARFFSLRSKYKIIKRFSEQNSLLDIGCGTGEFIAFCKSRGMSVTGMEPGEKARNFASSKHQLSIAASLEELTGKNRKFGVITLWHVLEHIHNLNIALESVRSLLANQGTLVIAVPNCRSADAQKFGVHWAAYDVPRHLYHFDTTTLTRLLRNHGFTVQNVLPQKLDAYYVSLLSEKYRSGTSGYLKAFLNGISSNLKGRNPQFGYSSQIFIVKSEIR
jgi:2-polyprenyl-3-methyl-5-hydroxy-6-metoxy-1,4-benzoquinol methylase